MVLRCHGNATFMHLAQPIWQLTTAVFFLFSQNQTSQVDLLFLRTSNAIQLISFWKCMTKIINLHSSISSDHTAFSGHGWFLLSTNRRVKTSHASKGLGSTPLTAASFLFSKLNLRSGSHLSIHNVVSSTHTRTLILVCSCLYISTTWRMNSRDSQHSNLNLPVLLDRSKCREIQIICSPL